VKVGFTSMVMIQSKKGAAGPKFYKEHVNGFFPFWHEGDCAHEFVLLNTTVGSDFYCGFL
jgi:hypothetical protein